MKNFLVLIFMILPVTPALSFDDPFIDLVKKTSSVYSGVMSIDDDNSGDVLIETTLTGQKVFLTFSSRKLETTPYTLINNDPISSKSGRKSIDPPLITLGNTQILVNNISAPTLTCDGSDVVPTDVSCSGKKCTIIQRVISQCNAENCWTFGESENLPTDDRFLTTPKLESLRLNSQIDITDCLPSNLEGTKYRIKFTTMGSGPAAKAGGTIQYSLILKNDTVTAKRSN